MSYNYVRSLELRVGKLQVQIRELTKQNKLLQARNLDLQKRFETTDCLHPDRCSCTSVEL